MIRPERYERLLSVVQAIANSNVTLDELEELAVLARLEKNNWKQNEASEDLGVSPRVLNYKIGVLGLTNLVAEKVKERRRLEKKSRDEAAAASAGAGACI